MKEVFAQFSRTKGRSQALPGVSPNGRSGRQSVLRTDLESVFNVQRPEDDKVLRLVDGFLAPSTPAMRLVLRHVWVRVPTFDELKRAVAADCEGAAAVDK